MWSDRLHPDLFKIGLPDANGLSKTTGCIRTGLDASGLISHMVGTRINIYRYQPYTSSRYSTYLWLSRRTKINSAGALLAIRLLSDVFPQYIRKPSVSISTVQ